MIVHNNGQEIIKGTRNKQTGMWEVTLETQQSETMVNNIMAHTNKPELSKYLPAALFSPTTARLLKVIKQGFLKIWPGLTEKLTKKNLEKLRNTLIGHIHMRRQEMKSNIEKSKDIDLEYKRKTNVVICTTVDPGTTKESKFYSYLCGHFPTTSSIGNKYIYGMYVYDCNTILMTEIKNRSDKEIIWDFAEFTEDLKSIRINPGVQSMDNEASEALKMTMTAMNIKYQLVPQSIHR